MGGPDYRFNYTKISCQARQGSGGCRVKCEHKLSGQRKEKVVNGVPPLVVSSPLPDTTTEDRDIRERPAIIQPVQEVIVGNKPVKVCLECSEKKPICARGLCGACYARLSKEGTLDDRYPAKKPQKVRADKGKAQPSRKSVRPITAEPLPVFEETADAPGGVVIVLQFNDRDQGLLLALQGEAEAARRRLADHILYLLEQQVVS
jgi:hypothetical protein